MPWIRGHSTYWEAHDGLFHEPTLLSYVTPNMRICYEGTFGPVVPIISVDIVEEAIAVANDSE